MRSGSRWLIHIGLHKTGTTHIQDQLSLMAPMLVETGISYVGRDFLRDEGLLNILRKEGSFRFAPSYLRRVLAARRLKDAGHSSGTILISDENISGRVGEVFVDPPYPRLDRHLRAVRDITGQDLSILVCVRNPATLLPSAYAQMIRFEPPKRSLAEYIEKWMKTPPRWPALFDRIRAIFPRAEIIAWTFEDYASNPGMVFRGLVGLDIETPDLLEISPSTMRPTREAITAIETLPKHLRRIAYQAAASQLILENQSGTRFEPLNQEQLGEIGRNYESDLRSMERRDILWLYGQT